MKKGNWCGPYAKWKRCNSKRCSRCINDPSAKPHGPYYNMSRRNPITGKHEQIYFGVDKPPDEVVDRLNTMYLGEDKPTKQQIKDLAEILGYLG